MCVKDIGCRMIEKNSNVPRIIDRLELKKLVSRTTSSIDKRETVMTLTDDGINTLENASTRINKAFSLNIELDEEDATQLNLLLERMREKE
jgi:DNA-binding MarR family transcriptional regulator